MDKHKKKVLIVVAIVLAVIAGIAIILSFFLKDDEPNNPTDNPSSNQTMNKEIEKLTDELTFFALAQAINDYYYVLSNRQTSKLYSLLDKSYIEEYSVTENNIYQIINADYDSVSYVAKNILYNPNSSTTYYFINGYFIQTSMMEDDATYQANVNYLIIKDRDQNYTIRPISNDNMVEYAKNYDLVDVKLNNHNILKSGSISEENKLTLYINEFLNLLFFDMNRAYQMLDTKTKSKYQNFDDFNQQIMEIYESLTPKIFSYHKTLEEGKYTYQILDDNQKNITIIENGPMDYLINY